MESFEPYIDAIWTDFIWHGGWSSAREAPVDPGLSVLKFCGCQAIQRDVERDGYIYIYTYEAYNLIRWATFRVQKSRSRGKDEKQRQEKAKMRKKTKHWNVKTPTPKVCVCVCVFFFFHFFYKTGEIEFLTFFWTTDWGYIYIYIFFYLHLFFYR